ncbi:hypothetical protein ME7_01553 [Bartonella birtlesii LL-WM9]|uniref:Uncharacterized protein n=1 Tax=Bartonella birtlesii LL-WM9 TaxID=1094552 RepID=J1IRW3_9HYPH|nr:hypothetical protein ME7_01553 [Bartonella birtlesii LL-WM9]
MIQKEKCGGKKSLNGIVIFVFTKLNILYQTLSSPPNNAYQSYLCLKNPIKKFLKATLFPYPMLKISKEYARGIFKQKVLHTLMKSVTL